MTPPRSIIVIQTAFIGDAILTLPMIQRIRRSYPGTALDVMCIPPTAEIFRSHADVGNVVVYDKRGADRGMRGLVHMSRILSRAGYDAAMIPHRSIRSALIPALAKIPVRIGFDKSAGAFLMTHIVRYQGDVHEIERNLALAREIGVRTDGREFPLLAPSANDTEAARGVLIDGGISSSFVAIAPGSVWATKRWLPERFAGLARELSARGVQSVLVGGNDDRELCLEIARMSGASPAVAAGCLTLLQSAALLKMSRLLVTNDTAPLHLAVAVRTPVIAIFGPTVPAFGFAPYGESDVVIENLGLSCRPCAIHGGKKCPIGTFECMKRIEVESVIGEVLKRIG